jgi:hypothetical protein
LKVVFSGYHENGLLTRFASADYAVGACHDVVIAVWRKRTLPDGIAVLRDYIDERAKLHQRLGLLQIIEDNAAPPDPMARKALAKMHLEQAPLIHRSAVVYAKPGFAGATARAIITGVAMLNPPKFEHQIFADIPSALHWVYLNPAAGKTLDALNMLGQAVALLQSLDTYVPSSSKTRVLERK